MSLIDVLKHFAHFEIVVILMTNSFLSFPCTHTLEKPAAFQNEMIE
jgi:hypothetical protein